jgi:transcriptional regulator with XRE-family HTH domain
MYKVWCPYCYEDARNAGQVVVDQLIWTLKDITVCSVHSSKLLDKCPKCNARSLWLSRYTLPGYCSRCKVWLGKSRPFKGEGKRTGGDEYALWCAKSVADLLAAGNNFRASTEEQLLEKIAAFLTHGPPMAYAMMLDVSDGTISQWSRKERFPRWKSILKIARLSQNTLTEYLDARVSVDNLKFIELQRTRKKKGRQARFDRSKLQALANEALCEYPPPTLADVARRIRKRCPLQYRKSALTRRVPDLSRKIVDRHRRYNEKLNETRRRLLRAFAADLNESPISVDEVMQSLQVSA